MKKFEVIYILPDGEVFTQEISATKIEVARKKIFKHPDFIKNVGSIPAEDIEIDCKEVFIPRSQKYPGKEKKKYNVGYTLSTHMNVGRTHTVCVRVNVNGQTVYCPTHYSITKAQWGNKDFSGTRAELRDEILDFLNKEIDAVKVRLDDIPEEELSAMDRTELYETAFQRSKSSRGGAKKTKKDSDLKTITTAIPMRESVKSYIRKVANKCGYSSLSTFLNEAIFATMTGVAKADDLNPASIKAEYMRYMRNPERYIKILKGEIEEPIKPNRKRYKYGLGF